MGHADGLMDTGGSSGSDEVRMEEEERRKKASDLLSLRPSASSLARTKKQIRFSVTLFLPLPAFAHLSSTPYALKYSITIASWRRRIQARGARYSDEVRFLSRLIFSPSPKRRERGEEGEREREAEKKLGPLVLASPLQRCPQVAFFSRDDSFDTPP
jgi:hypothetical protein